MEAASAALSSQKEKAREASPELPRSVSLAPVNTVSDDGGNGNIV